MKKILLVLSVLALFACSNKGPQTYRGHIKGLNDQQTIIFTGKSGQHVIATLIAPDTANLRINQLISPSGVADGPFGRELQYDLNETGNWKFVVGGSLMQGDDYAGDFTLSWELK